MATLTWTIETADGTAEFVKTLTDANMTRWLSYALHMHPQYDMTDPENPVLKPRTPQTEAQAFRDWAGKEWNVSKNKGLRWEIKGLQDAVTVDDLE